MEMHGPDVNPEHTHIHSLSLPTHDSTTILRMTHAKASFVRCGRVARQLPSWNGSTFVIFVGGKRGRKRQEKTVNGLTIYADE